MLLVYYKFWFIENKSFIFISASFLIDKTWRERMNSPYIVIVS